MFPPKSTPYDAWTAPEKVIVAVKAEKIISKDALAWALTHVVRPGDCITLLAVFPGEKTGRKFWGFPRLNGDCRSSGLKIMPDRVCQISQSCSQMVLQFHEQIEVRVQIKVVSGVSSGAVAAEAKSSAASWVVLDKKLKQESSHCLDELHCNIVMMMKGSQPKVLRLNFGCSNELKTPLFSAPASPEFDTLQDHRMKHSTPVSSPEEPSISYTRSTGDNSLSSPDTSNSFFLIYEQNPLFEGPNKGKLVPTKKQNNIHDHGRVFWIPQNHIVHEKTSSLVNKRPEVFNSSIREAVSLSRTSSIPPPLCTLCQEKAPAFGKPPRRFHYRELEEATDGFSDVNFLAEGGFGWVHRGILKDGLVVAIKQFKSAGNQADMDFYREVRVLSCAQHRNIVLLIGFCIEVEKRVLVYEYICNGSLDFHLHGNKRMPLDLRTRLKIAIGTARGLRYLHEDCRVGCIIHRDVRPNNILLTHDFEPLVADFGLSMLHSETDICEDELIVGTSGYLPPEYFDGGKITEKVDIYAFGLVLLELITGKRNSNLHRHPLFENFYPPYCSLPFELEAMSRAASMCLLRDPDSRPPMSKVLRVLEGGDRVVPLALDLNSIGSRSGRMQGLRSNMRHRRRLSH